MEPSVNNPYRKMLNAAVSSVLIELNVDTVGPEVLETLTEMIQCFLVEVANLSKNYYELSGRTEPIIADIILAFVEMGIDFTNLSKYAMGSKHTVLPTLQAQTQPKQLGMLQAGVKQSLPSFIPPHLPPFPDPHAYIRTPTHKQPVIDYEAIREKFAVQKRDVEKALTKFLAKTSPTHSLFDTDEFMFPLIACKPQFPAYLSALLPQDQIFDPEDLEYKTEELATPPKKRAKSESEKDKEAKEEPDDLDEDDDDMGEPVKLEESTAQSIMDIDNPYLAATKLPTTSEEPPSVTKHAS